MTRRHRRENVTKAIRPNLMDRVISYAAPAVDARRLWARAFIAIVGGYLGDAKSKRILSQWNPAT